MQRLSDGVARQRFPPETWTVFVRGRVFRRFWSGAWVCGVGRGEIALRFLVTVCVDGGRVCVIVVVYPVLHG